MTHATAMVALSFSPASRAASTTSVVMVYAVVGATVEHSSVASAVGRLARISSSSQAPSDTFTTASAVMSAS